MDSLTHGLLGLAIGALRRPDRDRNAVLLACVLAAELPDLDYLLPADNAVLHSLEAHRGLTHSALAAPVVALITSTVAKLVFRQARMTTLFAWSLPTVLVAHLLADAWTGWGTRLALPFSDARVSLDWMLVVDPLFTLPLLVGALWGLRKRVLIRRALLTGAAIACVYLGARVLIRAQLQTTVQRAYPEAESVTVFPSWFGPTHWRYVAVTSDRYVTGKVRIFGAPTEQALHPRPAPEMLRSLMHSNPTLHEVLAWARYPLVSEKPTPDAGVQVSIADLRYHLDGVPTLSFQIELDAQGQVRSASFNRGGSARSLFDRFRGAR